MTKEEMMQKVELNLQEKEDAEFMAFLERILNRKKHLERDIVLLHKRLGAFQTVLDLCSKGDRQESRGGHGYETTFFPKGVDLSDLGAY